MTSELSITHFVFFYKNLTKVSQHESKSGFFLLARSHIGRNSGFSSKIGMVGESDYVTVKYGKYSVINAFA